MYYGPYEIVYCNDKIETENNIIAAANKWANNSDIIYIKDSMGNIIPDEDVEAVLK